MGRSLRAAAEDEGGFIVTGGSEMNGPTVREAASTADVWIDFTTPDATLAALDDLRETGVRAVVIGTTGFSEAQIERLNRHGDRFAIVRSGNFSTGINILQALVARAAESLGTDWDIEITESHHRHKVDAPSGTALMLGEAAAQGRGKTLEELRLEADRNTGAARETGGVGFAVRRGGGIIGAHDVMFASASETITLSHDALDRSVFARGALKAARWAAGRDPGLYDMTDVLGL